MRRSVNRALRKLAKAEEACLPENIGPMQRGSLMLAAQSLVMGLLFLGPPDNFLRPKNPPDAIWLALSMGQIEIWDILFPLAFITVALSVYFVKYIEATHFFSALVWFVFGMIWSIGGMLDAPTYLFAAGLLAIFVSAQHFAILGIWRAEGVV